MFIRLLDYYIVFLSSKWYTGIYREEYMANALEEAPVTLPQPSLYDLYTAAIAATDPRPEWSGGMRLGLFAQSLLDQGLSPIGIRVEVTEADSDYPIGDALLPGIYRIAGEPYRASFEDGQQLSLIELVRDGAEDQPIIVSADQPSFTPFQIPRKMEIDSLKELWLPSGWAIGMDAYVPFPDPNKEEEPVQRFLLYCNKVNIHVAAIEGHFEAASLMARAKMIHDIDIIVGLPVDEKQTHRNGKMVPIIDDNHTVGIYIKYGQLTTAHILNIDMEKILTENEIMERFRTDAEFRAKHPRPQEELEELFLQALAALQSQA